MTATDPAALTCPECGAVAPVAMSDGTWFCPSCRCEWDEAQRPVFESPPAVVAPPTTTGAVPASVDIGEPEPAPVGDVDLVGTRVMLEGGATVTIVELIDDDWLRVRYASGREEAVSYAVVERSLEPPRDVTPVEIDMPDEVAAGVGSTTLVIAGLILNAGAGAVDTSSDPPAFRQPASDWLPRDADQVELVELAVAYAVAALIVTYGISVDEVRALGEGFIEQRQQQLQEAQDDDRRADDAGDSVGPEGAGETRPESGVGADSF